MSVKAMTWVFEHSPYTLGARLVHLALADVANDAHDNRLWMYQAEIANKAGLSVSQVQRVLAKMLKDGTITELERGQGRGKVSVYRLVMKTPQYDVVSTETPASTTIKPRNGDICPLINSNKHKDDFRAFDVTPVDDIPGRVAELRRSMK